MKIEVLYVADCPTHPAAVALVRNVLATQGIDTEVSEVLISDDAMAQKLQFCGSPTVRVNGRDVVADGRAEGFSMCCRLYPGSNQVGLPPIDAVRRAVVAAIQEGFH
jgi:hypothetical protein